MYNAHKYVEKGKTYLKTYLKQIETPKLENIYKTKTKTKDPKENILKLCHDDRPDTNNCMARSPPHAIVVLV